MRPVVNIDTRIDSRSHGILKQAGWRLIGPLKFILIFWALLIANYFFGPASYPFPSLLSVFYFGGVLGALFLGVYFGNGGSLHHSLSARFKDGKPLLIERSIVQWSGFALVVFTISAVSSLNGFRLVVATGRTIDQAVYETGFVRGRDFESAGLASALSNAVGFLSYTWLLVSFVFLRFAGGRKRISNVWLLVSSGVGVCGVLLQYFVQVSRNAYLVLILLVLFYIAIVERGQLKQVIYRLGKTARMSAVVILVVVMSYMLFIAVNRTGDKDESLHFVKAWIPLQYRLLPVELIDQDLAAGIYKLQWYAGHSLRNLNEIINSDVAMLEKGGTSSVLYWPTLQLARIWPESEQYISESARKYGEMVEVLNENAWQWGSGFAALICDFGLLGSILWIAMFGMIIGWSYRDFWMHGSMVSAAICLWISLLCTTLPFYFPIDNFYYTNLYFVLSLKVLCLLIDNRSL